MTEVTMQINEIRTWIDIPDGLTMDDLSEVPVIRNGGPRDGSRMGTAYPDGDAFNVHLFDGTVFRLGPNDLLH